MGSVAKKGLQQYLAQLQQHPLRNKMITADVLSAISDSGAEALWLSETTTQTPSS